MFLFFPISKFKVIFRHVGHNEIICFFMIRMFLGWITLLRDIDVNCQHIHVLSIIPYIWHSSLSRVPSSDDILIPLHILGFDWALTQQHKNECSVVSRLVMFLPDTIFFQFLETLPTWVHVHLRDLSHPEVAAYIADATHGYFWMNQL